MTRCTWCPASPPWLFTHEAQACMVSEVWLIDEGSGPVQLHRSAIVTVLDELAAPAGAVGVAAMLTAPATASEPIAIAAAVFFARTNTCTPLGPPAHPDGAFAHRHPIGPLLGDPSSHSPIAFPDYTD